MSAPNDCARAFPLVGPDEVYARMCETACTDLRSSKNDPTLVFAGDAARFCEQKDCFWFATAGQGSLLVPSQGVENEAITRTCGVTTMKQ